MPHQGVITRCDELRKDRAQQAAVGSTRLGSGVAIPYVSRLGAFPARQTKSPHC